MNDVIIERLRGLRNYMKSHGLAAFIVGSSDPHGSEYVADRWKAREWISGFTGSAGTAVITTDKALLWTDSRYWLAAEKELSGTGFSLMKDGLREVPAIADWLKDNLEKGDVAAVDGTVYPNVDVFALRSSLSENEISLDISHDPFEILWNNRPDIPMSKAEILPVEYTGETVVDKLQRVRENLASRKIDATFIPALDEIAWLTNLRGADVDYNPVLVSYMLVSAEDAILFIESDKITNTVRKYLHEAGISIAGYSDVWQTLREYGKSSILLPNRCNAYIIENIPPTCKIYYSDSIVASMKAVKNATEIKGFEKAMCYEGVAMVKLLYWLKNEADIEKTTEIDVDRKLTELRSENEEFRGLSFATIAAYGENAAIVHYEPTPQSHSLLQPKGFLLLDCGGQYRCGTTDITRTIALGELTQEEKEDYTRVLRGHISLAMTKFPKWTCGTQLDAIARQWLWQAGENYMHGTGHGVGHYLNVHEGPHQIRMNFMPYPLMPGMTITNEPGIYKAGRHGIRIENTMLVKEFCSTEFGDFYSLSPLTICPIDKTAVLPELLGIEAIEYLNDYHRWVFEMLSPYFDDYMFEFLKQVCAPI